MKSVCDVEHDPAVRSLKMMMNCDHEWMNVVSNNAQIDCGIQTIINYWYYEENIPHAITSSLPPQPSDLMWSPSAVEVHSPQDWTRS